MTERTNEQEKHAEALNFTAKREEFLETFFRKGAEFADELIRELQILKQKNADLAKDNALLRHQLASDDSLRELVNKIEELEKERNHLRSHIENATSETRDFADRYSDVEKELDAMANLYVASYQLHVTLDPIQVLGVIEQLLAQLVGVSSFAIFLTKEQNGEKTLEPVHAYHCDRARGVSIRWNEGPIGEAASTQVYYVADPDAREPGTPVACIPMVLGEQTIGVIAAYDLFEQKRGFVNVDFELFKLLAFHSASAIVGAGLMSRSGGKVDNVLEGYPRL